ncbi:MAG TPA: tetratricopeptide repeat protein, partial [Cellvibrionaceae bacterium]|nr:tetratricopeptide repeat protein [Cellvibrionaceae bacterium]
PDTARSLHNLATFYFETGAYVQAQPLFEDAVGILKAVLGPRHPDSVTSLSYLAGVYFKTGAYAKAQPLLEEALAIRKAVLGPRHPDIAESFLQLAWLYRVTGAYARAKSLLEEAVAIHKVVLGARHPDTAVSLNSLATLYTETGSYTQAQPLLVEALAIRKAVLGPRHPDTATSFHSLAAFYFKTGAYAQAQPLFEEALEIRKAVLGLHHPAMVSSFIDLGDITWIQDDWVAALQHLRGAVNVEEANLRSVLTLGDESRKRAFMATLEESTSAMMSFVGGAAAHVPEAISLGLEVVLQRKGRMLDALAESLARIRRSATPEDQALWARYVAVQTDWAAMTLRGPSSQPVDQYRARLAELEQQAGQVATELSSRSSKFRTVLEPVTLAQVQRAIPPRAVLLEWVRYHPFNPKAIKMEPSWGAPRYAVYVLKPHGAPVFVDLGEADILDRQIADLLAAVRYPGGMQGKQVLAHDLYRRLIQPVQVHLGSATNLFLSPDGQLNLP